MKPHIYLWQGTWWVGVSDTEHLGGTFEQAMSLAHTATRLLGRQ